MNKKLNVELLLKVKQHILDEPARLRMDSWLVQGQPNSERFIPDNCSGYGEPDSFKFPVCGTVGCIAGWTFMLAHPEIAQGAIAQDAKGGYASYGRAIQELNILEDYMPFNIFYVDYWPSPYKEAYVHAENNEDRAKIVAMVIDKFIEEYAQ